MKKKLMKIYNQLPQPLQTIGINIIESNQWRIQKSKEFKKWFVFLQKTEHWKKKEFKSYQTKLLKNMLSHSANYVPFYHDFYKKNNVDISKIKTTDDLYKIPIIKKEDIHDYWNLFCSKKKEKYTTRQTSGTTGKPLKIRISHSLDILEKANAYRRNTWAGYDGSWIARFVGDNPIKDCNSGQLFRKSYAMSRVLFPTYCISLKTLPMIINNLKKLNIKYLQCYPSAGYIIAKFLEMNDEYLPLKSVLYSSEPMYDFQRKLIQDRFQTKTFGFYGQAEKVISAVECEKGNYHLTMIDGILEIINNGENVGVGEKGLAVVTSLHNHAMPLIRYALNDFTGYCDLSCKCGRTSPLIYPIETKVRDFIITPMGKLISPPLLSFPIRTAQNIIESQFVQKSTDRIIVRIVKAKEYNRSNEQVLLESLKQLLGNEISIKIEYVNKIYETSAYKKRFVINELGENYFEKAIEKFR